VALGVVQRVPACPLNSSPHRGLPCRSAEDAVREVTDFYRVFHSSRIVGDDLVFRLTRPLTDDNVKDIQRRFEDLLKGRWTSHRGRCRSSRASCPSFRG
jgi:hypothetical protein